MTENTTTPPPSNPDKYSARGQVRTFIRFLKWLLPVWDKVLLALLGSIVLTTVTVVDPWLAKFLIDDAFPNQDYGLFYGLFAAGIAMALLWRVMLTMNGLLNLYIDVRVGLTLRIDFFRHLERLSMTFHENRPVGEHMYRAESDIAAVMGMVTDILPRGIRAIYAFFLILIFMTWLDWRVTVVILIYAIPYTMLAQKIGTWTRRIEREIREKWQKVDAGLQEGIAGSAVVQTFGRRQHEVRRYVELVQDGYRAIWRIYYALTLQGHVIGGAGMLPWLKTQIVTAYFMYKVILGDLTYGSVFPIFTYMNRLANPIQEVVQILQQIRVALVPAERIMDTLDVVPVVVERAGAKRMPPIVGRIEFKNVSFAYEDGQPVLKDVSFSVEPGKKIGIVGSSGSGKSTIVNLLLRLYDPSEGAVLVDGRDLRDVRMTSYQDQVGLVLQDTYLFNGTLRDNVLFGKPDANQKQIEDAVKSADLQDFVATLENGYDTNLREGARLSGGQKQRIGIARAMIRNPRILIMDEPTSSLDSASEERVYQTLNQVGEGRTAFIVSHRLSTIRDADEILVLAEGRIAERGTHTSLLQQRGIYYDMYNLYSGQQNNT